MADQSSQPQTFADQVRAIPGGEHIEDCYSCGTCVSKCMIQQKLEPRFNPRRLLRLVMMNMRREAFESPTTWLCSTCDLCYSSCPQEIHISSIIGAVKQLAVEAGYESPLETVSVEQERCSGCGICAMSCPYEAPHLVEKEINGDLKRVAEVNANLCMGCGICVAACPLGVIARPGVSNEEVRARIAVPETNGAPRLVVFICDWSLRVDADITLLESYPKNVHIIHIPCTGRIDPEMALLALHAGFDGVLVCGCAAGECHYQRGTFVSSCKIGLLNQVLDQIHIDFGRIRLVRIGTQDRGRIRKEVDSMLEHLTGWKETQ